jgi:alkylation response protein AidB-like acyl-CoA dehydrogenase
MVLNTAMAERDVLEAVERVRPVIERYREEGERQRHLSPQVIDAMDSEGLFRLWLPAEYGGSEVDLPTYLKAVEGLSRLDSAAGWMQGIIGTSAVLAALLPEAGAREVFANGALSAGSVIPRGRAVPVDGGYRVTGRWPLMSGCHHAAWLAGNSLIFDGAAPRMRPNGAPEFTMMVFAAEDGTIIDTWHSTGMRATGSADFAVEDVFVPEHRCFSVFGTESRLPGPLYKMRVEMHFFTSLAVVGLGIARAAIDSFMQIAREKTPTLSQNPLNLRPTIHAEVAKAEARLQAARSYLYEVAREIESCLSQQDRVPDETEARRRLACVNAAEACEQVVDAMYRLGGSTAIFSGNPLDRCLRDIHTINQHLAVSPVWWEKTGQYYFGQGLGMP